MSYVHEMLEAHPRLSHVDSDSLADCIQACYDCAQSCTACADACLGESEVHSLIRCIRLNLDCADTCATTGQMLSRRTEAEWGLLQKQIEVCLLACRVCGAECEKHAHHHEHCQVCAQACHRCESTCHELLGEPVL